MILHFVMSAMLAGLGFSQKTEPVLSAKMPVGEAWLGLGVTKPDEAATTHLPLLPPGIGFTVTALDKGGPAEKAGIRKLDLIWQMNGQMLVNEGQLATLLRISSPAEEVTLSLFREGQAMDLKVKLGESRDDNGAGIRRMLNDSVMRRDDGALRIVNVEKKTAAITNELGSAEVSRVEGGDSVRILDTGGKLVFEGIVSGRPEYSGVPEGWRRQVCAMRRGLDHALSSKAAPMRQPRPRIVPPVPPEE